MASPNQGLKSDGKLRLPADSATVISKGDFCFLDVDDVKPASSQTDQLSEGDNQGLFASLFVGIAEARSDSGSTTPDVLLDANQDRERLFACASATHEVGDLLGVDEDGAGTALLDATLATVTSLDAAIAVVTERNAAAATTVKGRLIRGGTPTQTMGGRAEVNTETLAGNLTLTCASAKFQFLDPNGARDLTLPPEASSKGLEFVVVNAAGGAEVITIKNDAAGTICTPTQNETAHLFCDGTTWAGSVGANS